MVNKLELNDFETFSYSSRTKDGYKFAVGGLCLKGYKEVCTWNFKAMEKVEIGINKSGYFIDFMFGRYIMKLSSLNVKAVCGSINVSNEGDIFGGIIGSPHIELNSANGELEQVGENIYVIAYPGRMGIAFVSDYKKALELQSYMQSINNIPLIEAVNKAVSFAELMLDTFIISSDGSGENSYGTIYTSGQKWCVL